VKAPSVNIPARPGVPTMPTTTSERHDGWTVTIDATNPAIGLSDRHLEQLVDLFADYGGSMSSSPNRLSVTFSIDAGDLRPPVEPTILSAADFACGVLNVNLTAIGESGWSIVGVHVRTYAEHDAELRQRGFTA
jgi:hypothetical protein